jgi:serine/threonine-protein kinase RsbT
MRDVERARRTVRAFALTAGLPAVQVEELVLATSEVTQNVVQNAAPGTMTCRLRDSIIEVLVEDFGPGIADLGRAMEDRFSTGGSLGSGLPGARRLVDSFHIETSPNGTRILLEKRLPTH